MFCDMNGTLTGHAGPSSAVYYLIGGGEVYSDSMLEESLLKW
jgi:hypothetical protein